MILCFGCVADSERRNGVKVRELIREARKGLNLLPLPGEGKRALEGFLRTLEAAGIISEGWTERRAPEVLRELAIWTEDHPGEKLWPSKALPLVMWLLDHSEEVDL